MLNVIWRVPEYGDCYRYQKSEGSHGAEEPEGYRRTLLLMVIGKAGLRGARSPSHRFFKPDSS